MKAASPMDQPHAAAASDGTAKTSWKKLIPLACIGLLIVLFFMLGLNDYLTFESLRDHRETLISWYQSNQIMAIACYFIAYALIVAFSVPGATWMTLAGGFMFGTVMATAIVVVAATLGALGIFLIARYALADCFHEKTGNAGARMEKGFRENALSYLLFLRMVPLFPFWLVNLVPAFLNVPARTFVIGTFVGIIPGTAVFCSVGNGLGAVFKSGGMPDLKIIFEPEILTPILGLAILSLVPIIYKKVKSART